jgi:hypothetical protein
LQSAGDNIRPAEFSHEIMPREIAIASRRPLQLQIPINSGEAAQKLAGAALRQTYARSSINKPARDEEARDLAADLAGRVVETTHTGFANRASTAAK